MQKLDLSVLSFSLVLATLTPIFSDDSKSHGVRPGSTTADDSENGGLGSICGGSTGITCQSDHRCLVRTTHKRYKRSSAHSAGICVANGSGEGRMCGGFAGLTCQKGLACRIRNALPRETRDASGICVPKSKKGGQCNKENVCPPELECKLQKIFYHPDADGICVAKSSPVGQMCGGIAGLLCDDGFDCKLRGHFPDASGVCVKAKLGELGGFCGGFAGIQCRKGSMCQIQSNFPDASGKCIKAPSPLGLVAHRTTGSGDEGTACTNDIKCLKGLNCLRPKKNGKDRANGICGKPPIGDEGGMCGGIAGITCIDNLTCITREGVGADLSGICVSTNPAKQFCGGIAGFQCAKGLTCELKGAYPDAGGVCVKKGRKTTAGGMCGGIAGIMCPKKFTCQMTAQFPDAAGICVSDKPADGGTFCGGFGGFRCKTGFACQLDDDFPDAGGHCVRANG